MSPKISALNIKICKPIVEDAKGINEVFYKTWISTYPNEEYGITKDDIEDRYKDIFSEEKINKRKEQIKNNNQSNYEYLFVAKDEKKVVGVCCIIKYQNDQQVNQLKAIYILPEYQGLGIGYELWQECLKFFDLTKDIIVQVATYNNKAIEFYKKLGFKDTFKRFKDEGFKMKSGNSVPEMEMIIKSA